MSEEKKEIKTHHIIIVKLDQQLPTIVLSQALHVRGSRPFHGRMRPRVVQTLSLIVNLILAPVLPFPTHLFLHPSLLPFLIHHFVHL